MSQVIVTEDNLNTQRRNSAVQEHHIDREGQFKKWRRNDITGFDPIAAAAGVAAAPFVVLFWCLSLVSKAAIYVALIISRLVGKIVGPTK